MTALAFRWRVSVRNALIVIGVGCLEDLLNGFRLHTLVLLLQLSEYVSLLRLCVALERVLGTMQWLLHPVTVNRWHSEHTLLLARFMVVGTSVLAGPFRPSLCTKDCTVVRTFRSRPIGIMLLVANNLVRHLTGTCRVPRVLNRPLVLLVLPLALCRVLMIGDSGGTH